MFSLMPMILPHAPANYRNYGANDYQAHYTIMNYTTILRFCQTFGRNSISARLDHISSYIAKGCALHSRGMEPKCQRPRPKLSE